MFASPKSISFSNGIARIRILGDLPSNPAAVDRTTTPPLDTSLLIDTEKFVEKLRKIWVDGFCRFGDCDHADNADGMYCSFSETFVYKLNVCPIGYSVN